VSDWKSRYEANKADVDKLMGRSLGGWGQFKAFFSSDSITDARKAAIRTVERGNALYQPENFIGTTGQGQNATFYYRSRNNSFGHITQAHDIPENVGREPHHQSNDYQMRADPQGRLQEWAHGQRFHTSRNPFVPKAQLPQGWEQEEQRVRTTHTELKPLADPNVRKRVLGQ